MSIKTKSRLGRGLSSLLSVSDLPVERGIPQSGVTPADAPAAPSTPLPTANLATTMSDTVGQARPSISVLDLPLDSIIPNPYQPRRQMDPVGIAELAESLKATGLIQPIVVCRATGEEGKFELIAGERRWRAATTAGLTTIPAIVKEVDVHTQARLALIENIHRVDLNPMERALAYKSLMQQQGGLTQEQLALQLGEERSTVANVLRLLALCDAAQAMLLDGRISLGHAKVLAGVPDILEQQRLAALVLKHSLPVRQLEMLVEAGPGRPPVIRPTAPGNAAHLQELEHNLSRQLGLRVQVRAAVKKGKGRLVLHYANLDQFDELLTRLGLQAE